MEFRGQGRPLSEDGVGRLCAALAIEAPAMWAVVTVETAGFGFLPDRRPRILFERHIFRRLTGGRFDAGHADISNETPGGYVGGPGEYDRLAKAMALDEQAALKSASWGIGQVMGSNHVVAGFDNVNAMVAEMVRNEDAQLMAMMNFIKGSHLAGALQSQDWTSFARGYNGQDFQKNQYDTRLATAHAKCMNECPNVTIRTAQAALLYLGFDPGPVDGLPGRRTRAALIQFQQRAGLPAGGELSPDTESRLLEEAFRSPSP